MSNWPHPSSYERCWYCEPPVTTGGSALGDGWKPGESSCPHLTLAIETTLHLIAAECAKPWPEHRCFFRLIGDDSISDAWLDEVHQYMPRCTCGRLTTIGQSYVLFDLESRWWMAFRDVTTSGDEVRKFAPPLLHRSTP